MPNATRSLMAESPQLQSRLSAILATGHLEARLLQQFGAFIESAPDEELFRMSPLRYAQRADIPVPSAIDLFLYATHAGILEFCWGILCPSCGAMITSESGCRWLKAQTNCSLCQLDIEPSVDDQVEIAFTVSPTVRSIRFHDLESLDFERDGIFVFFSTSIALYPQVHQIVHSAVQSGYHIAPDSVQEIPVRADRDHFLLMVPSTHSVAHIAVREIESRHDASFDLVLDGQLVPNAQAMAPGESVIRVRNATSSRIALGLLRDSRLAPTPPEERSGALYTVTPYLTGKRLLTQQTFRDLFHAESLPPDQGLEIKGLTLLFTDLTGSTEMYERMGDIRAFALVREHFHFLRRILAEHGGAVVKTMGDAIMASFSEPLPALRAAVAMKREIKKMDSRENLTLKIGIHEGRCVAVEQNGQLDYFGQAVNVASRVQSEAGADEIVCTEAVFECAGAADVVAAARLNVRKDTVQLRGTTERIGLYRMV